MTKMSKKHVNYNASVAWYIHANTYIKRYAFLLCRASFACPGTSGSLRSSLQTLCDAMLCYATVRYATLRYAMLHVCLIMACKHHQMFEPLAWPRRDARSVNNAHPGPCVAGSRPRCVRATGERRHPRCPKGDPRDGPQHKLLGEEVYLSPPLSARLRASLRGAKT